jgi:hypothetical protein
VEHAVGRPGGPGDLNGQEALGFLAGLSLDEARQLPFVAGLWDPARVRDRVETATDRELLAARDASGVAASLLPSDGLPGFLGRVGPHEMRALVTVALVVLREYPLASDALGAFSSGTRVAGANALRYLR